MEHYDILIIGGGAAGICAAKAAYHTGCQSILLVEHKAHLGGILQQCAHHGFGTEQNGPEYIETLLEEFPDAAVCMTDTTVVRLCSNKTAVLSAAKTGVHTVSFSQLILATGCREIPQGALPIAGTRPMGVYTAGLMQEMMNVHGMIPDSPVVILGSGDIGLIMARQIAQIGGVVSLVEQKTVCGGMERNRLAIAEYAVPIYYETTVIELYGDKRLEAVGLENGTVLPCKTLLIAAGLCPNQELLEEIGRPDWLHLCGNCNRVHTMIESVVYEGKQVGKTACQQLRGAI